MIVLIVIILYLALGVISYILMRKMYLYINETFLLSDRIHLMIFSCFWPASLPLCSVFTLTDYIERNNKKPVNW